MTGIATLLATARPLQDGFAIDIPPGWLQGRTAYGGLSAALALHAAQGLGDDLPPLRSAQIAFIGPLSGAVEVRPTLLRRGRNAAFIQSDIIGETGPGFRATFVFMRGRDSAVAHDTAPAAPIAPPPVDASLYVGPENFFTGQFAFFDPKAAAGSAEWLRWARLRDTEGLDRMVELMAIGDALPPAAFKLFDKLTPLSSLNWQINLLDPAPDTRDGWWLLHATSDHAANGYSSQRMTIWNADGQCVAEAMQAVAIFG